ncbi:MAG: hypothetical protein PUP91_06100 [Rhizonema sp. PD37]|nr:hypothetical protein [Rhizonema sp. PD37]
MMLKTPPFIVTLELLGRVRLGVIWAVAQLPLNTQAPLSAPSVFPVPNFSHEKMSC